MQASSGTRGLVGLGTIVLGILALTSTSRPLTLVLISMIVAGGALVMNGVAVSSRLFLRKRRS